MTWKAGEYNGERTERGGREQDYRNNEQDCNGGEGIFRNNEQDCSVDGQEYKDCEKDYSDEKDRGAKKREAVLWYLERPRRIQKEIRRKQHKINDLRSSLTDIKVSYSDMPKNPSPPASRMEEVLTEVVDMEAEIGNMEEEKANAEAMIAELLCLVPEEKEQEALILLYLAGETWEATAENIGCSIRKLGMLRKNGIDSLSELPEKLFHRERRALV